MNTRRTALPPRAWCQRVLSIQHAVSELLAEGVRLTDSRLVNLTLRLERLLLLQADPQAGGVGAAIPGRS